MYKDRSIDSFGQEAELAQCPTAGDAGGYD